MIKVIDVEQKFTMLEQTEPSLVAMTFLAFISTLVNLPETKVTMSNP